MIGVWQRLDDKETEEKIDTATIVTTKAKNLMKPVQNSMKRMRVILSQELAGQFISNVFSEERITKLVTIQYPAEEMDDYSIKKDFRTTLNRGEAFQYEESEQLVF